MGVSTVVRLICFGRGDGPATPLDGQWLVEYDPTRAGRLPDGTPLRAHLVCTAVQARARRFDSPSDAFAYIRRTSGSARPGGGPDRPITAYALAFEPADEASILDVTGGPR